MADEPSDQKKPSSPAEVATSEASPIGAALKDIKLPKEMAEHFLSREAEVKQDATNIEKSAELMRKHDGVMQDKLAHGEIDQKTYDGSVAAKKALTDDAQHTLSDKKTLLTGDEQIYAETSRQVSDLSKKMGIPAPELHFKDEIQVGLDKTANGAAFNKWDDKIEVGYGNARAMSADERKFEMGHELGHDKLFREGKGEPTRAVWQEYNRALDEGNRSVRNPIQKIELAADAEAIKATCEPDGKNLDAAKRMLHKFDALNGATTDGSFSEAEVRAALKKPSNQGRSDEDMRGLMKQREDHPSTQERITNMEQVWDAYCAKPLDTPGKAGSSAQQLPGK